MIDVRITIGGIKPRCRFTLCRVPLKRLRLGVLFQRRQAAAEQIVDDFLQTPPLRVRQAAELMFQCPVELNRRPMHKVSI